LFESGHHSQVGQLFIVACLGLGRWDVADWLEETPVVEPVHPFGGGEFHRFRVAPGSTPVDHFGFEQAVDRLGEGVVIAVTDAADGRFDAGFGEALGIAN